MIGFKIGVIAFSFLSFLTTARKDDFKNLNSKINNSYVKNDTIYSRNKLKSDKILFLNYKISTDKDGKIIVNLINKVIAKGKIKSLDNGYKNPKEGDLEFSLLDDSSSKRLSYYLQNPLKKNYEYVNESGSFSNKQVKLNSTEFSIRVFLPKNCKFAVIKQILNSKKPQNSPKLLSKVEL
jgi:hypothetical protein